MKFEDLSNTQLKKVIKNYRLHLLKELTGYSKMSRDDLISLCKKLFDIDDEKVKPKITQPIYFDIPKGKQPKAEKIKKVKLTRAKPEPKPVPKPEPKPVPPKGIKNSILDELDKKRERIYTIMFKILNSPSKRSRQSLNKELGLNKDDYELIKKIFDGKDTFDFIPTPVSFFQDMLDALKDRDEQTFLEPSCGLGFVIHHVLKVNSKMKITAYEINYEFVQILNMLFPKEHYPNITFIRQNFLKANDNGNYSTIFCNPPFTKGTDSRYYINFFFECNRISKNSKSDYYENHIYFISPPLYPDMKGNIGIDTSAILTSSYLNKKRVEDILKKEFSNKEYKEFKEEKYESEIYSELENFEPVQVNYNGEVQFKTGTNFKANSYLCLNGSK